jgi:hypothetical protein
VQWGVVATPDSRLSPPPDDLAGSYVLAPNPRGPLHITEEPLSEIGR